MKYQVVLSFITYSLEFLSQKQKSKLTILANNILLKLTFGVYLETIINVKM